MSDEKKTNAEPVHGAESILRWHATYAKPGGLADSVKCDVDFEPAYRAFFAQRPETASPEWQALQGEQIAYLCDAAREEAYREAVEACAQVARQRAEDVRNGRSAEALTDYDRGEYHAGCWTETRIRALLTTPEKGEETK